MSSRLLDFSPMAAMKTGNPIALYPNGLDFFDVAYQTRHDLASSSSALYALFLPIWKGWFWSWATINKVVPHRLFLEVLRCCKLTSEPGIISEVISQSGYLVMAMSLKANKNNISLLDYCDSLLVYWSSFVFIGSHFAYYLKVIFLNDKPENVPFYINSYVQIQVTEAQPKLS